MNAKALQYNTTASPAVTSCCRIAITSELKLLLLDFRRSSTCPNGEVIPGVTPAGVRASSCQVMRRASASSKSTNAFRALSSTDRTSSSSAGSMSPVWNIEGRRMAAAFVITVAAVFAPVPINLMAVLVNARARAPVWSEEGELPNLTAIPCGCDSVGGGKVLRDCGIEGGRLICEVEDLRKLGGIANGGVVDSPNGGEYDIGMTADFSGVDALVGLKADTGRVTTLTRVLGFRKSVVGLLDASSNSTC